jgi:hypothetical protein
MTRAFSRIVLGVVLIATPTNLAASCFDACHDQAMIIYQTVGQQEATDYFHWCLNRFCNDE